MNSKAVSIIKKAICYVLGLFIITVGINISKMSALGISPVSSVPRALELIKGYTLGTTTFIIYILLVTLQFVVLRKNFKIKNILGILLTFGFSAMIDITGTDPKAIGHLLINFPRPQNYIMQLVYVVLSVLLIGVGVFLYLRPKWVPMPAEGLAEAISLKTGKAFGDCKTIVDTSMICLALLLQLIFLGGIHSFGGKTAVVRECTVIAAIFVGQTVKLITKFFGAKLEAWLG